MPMWWMVQTSTVVGPDIKYVSFSILEHTITIFLILFLTFLFLSKINRWEGNDRWGSKSSRRSRSSEKGYSFFCHSIMVQAKLNVRWYTFMIPLYLLLFKIVYQMTVYLVLFSSCLTTIFILFLLFSLVFDRSQS